MYRSIRSKRGRRLSVVVAVLVTATTMAAGVASATPGAARASSAQQSRVETAGDPIVATNKDGRLVVFVRHGDGTLWRRTQTATGDWGVWTSTGRKVTGNPAVGRNLDGRLEVFARGTDNVLWRQVQPAANSDTWNNWMSLGAPPNTTVDSNPAVVANDNTVANAHDQLSAGFISGNTDGRLEVFVRGADQAIWHRVMKSPNGGSGWTEWHSLGAGRAGTPAAAVSADGRLALFSLGTDGHLWHRAQKVQGTQQTPLGTWSEWKDLGGSFTGNIAVAVNRNGLIQAFVKDAAETRLWSVSQTKAGSASAPLGTWATKFDLGAKAATGPVVAANTDGRLDVFTVAPDKAVWHRAQTAPANTANPNGIWAAWQSLGGSKTSRPAITVTGLGRLDVFAIGADSKTLFHRPQLAAGIVEAPAGTWLSWATLWPIGSGICAESGTLDCFTIANANVSGVLDMPAGDNKLKLLPRSGAAIQQWSARKYSDGSFSIVNRSNGKCIDEFYEWLVLETCNGSDRQRWWLVPVTTGTDPVPSSYKLRQMADARMCVVVRPGELDKPQRKWCTDTDDHENWILGGAAGNAAELLDLALAYSTNLCNQHQATCEFLDENVRPAYQASPGCVVGTPLFNSNTSGDPASLTAEWSKVTGTQFAVGESLKLGLTLEGLGSLDTTFTTTHTWVNQTSQATRITVPVGPQQFGWVERAQVLKQATGRWSFSRTEAGPWTWSWTVSGKTVSAAEDGTDGKSTVAVAKTGPHPPNLETCG